MRRRRDKMCIRCNACFFTDERWMNHACPVAASVEGRGDTAFSMQQRFDGTNSHVMHHRSNKENVEPRNVINLHQGQVIVVQRQGLDLDEDEEIDI